MFSKKDNLKNKSTESPKTSPSSSNPPVEAVPHVNASKPMSQEKKPLEAESARKKGTTTRLIVKYDVGFNNSIYLRGEGADLSWERGIMLKNVKADEWLWESNIPFTKCEFKVLINDRQYELGENHRLQCGASFEYSPHFHKL